MKDPFSWPAMRDLAAAAHLQDRAWGTEVTFEADEALFVRDDGRLVFRSGPVLFVEPGGGPFAGE